MNSNRLTYTFYKKLVEAIDLLNGPIIGPTKSRTWKEATVMITVNFLCLYYLFRNILMNIK